MTGAEVRAVQDRLRALAFDPGPSDGDYGPATERAVWAFEKFVLDTPASEVSGIVTVALWEEMNKPLDVRPRRANPGNHIEVLLPQQVAVVYSDDVPVLITHVSTGSGEEWCSVVLVDEDDGTQTEQGICGIAVTPGGVFHIERRIDGWRNSKLGRLYNPLYFNYGIALHGATKVPKYPASRGCVRLPMHIAEYFPTLLANGDLVYVFDGVEQPETYGAQLPVFDYPDPNYTPASTTSTTSPTTAPEASAATTPPTSSTHPHPATEPTPQTTATPPSGTMPTGDGSSGAG
jgi:peptidoglycan hydrolase-like protein with peptidoglycan-binding domain